VEPWARARLGRHGWDAVADTVTGASSRTWESFYRLRHPGYFGTFVFNCYRQAVRETEVFLPGRPGGDSAEDTSSVSYPDRSDWPDWLRRHLDSLSPAEREVFDLHLKEYDHPEIAQQLGISEENSRTRLSRARARLRRCLQVEQEQ
jgi:DNA-directed RNA polymerase specialized sigma24 family protein